MHTDPSTLDHVGGLKALKEKCDFRVASHSKETKAIEASTGVTVDLSLEDRDVIPDCGGINVIHIPGHTVGNTCLMWDKTLFAGDTLLGKKGELRPSPSHYSSDPDEAKGGILKLEALEFDAIYLSHGEDILTGGKEKLKGLL